jgi:type III pantothenate kinase
LKHAVREKTLFIDAGNSRIKYATREKKKFTFHSADSVRHFLQECRTSGKKFSCGVYSSVRSVRDTVRLGKGIKKYCDQVYSVKELSKGILKTSYDMSCLGDDRLAVLLGCYFKKWAPCIILDAGTAITIDFLQAPNIFSGGFISSGFSTELAVLSEKTGRLPRLKPQTVSALDFPHKTESALLQGVIQTKGLGIRALIEKIFKKKKWNPAEWRFILTGGEAAYLKTFFPTALIKGDLVFIGLDLVCQHAWSEL